MTTRVALCLAIDTFPAVVIESKTPVHYYMGRYFFPLNSSNRYQEIAMENVLSATISGNVSFPLWGIIGN